MTSPQHIPAGAVHPALPAPGALGALDLLAHYTPPRGARPLPALHPACAAERRNLQRIERLDATLMGIRERLRAGLRIEEELTWTE